ncbi:MAG: hypothetical protein KKA60_09630 [Proteobacteria bacterium]|nr:hypothetical protein [Pseudomonadota bacterium]
MPAPKDPWSLEQPHRPEPDPAWQESWYFNFFDLSAGICGLCRIGYRPAAGRADGLFLAAVDGRPAVLYPAIGRRISSSGVRVSDARNLAAGSLAFSCKEALASWELSLHTRQVDAKMSFTPFTPAYFYPPPSAGEGKSAAHDHYEQAGRVSGGLRVGRTVRQINGMGQRDHSWGPRNWAGVGSWTWISAQFPSGWAFNLWSVGESPEPILRGFVGNAVENRDLAQASVKWDHDPAGRGAVGAKISLDTGNEVRNLRFSPLVRWPLYKDGAIIVETFGTFSVNGETGVGVTEYLYRAPRGPLSYLPHVPGMTKTALMSF